MKSLERSLLKRINKVSIELDVEVESRGDTARAAKLRAQLHELKDRLQRVRDAEEAR